MIHGLDTGFLMAAEMLEHAEHVAARATFARLLANRDMVAIAPQILAEFIHVATDPRRFVQPLATAAACQIAAYLSMNLIGGPGPDPKLRKYTADRKLPCG